MNEIVIYLPADVSKAQPRAYSAKVQESLRRVGEAV